jgi:pimeloyl-ACP methyl ester carboxylesterase
MDIDWQQHLRWVRVQDRWMNVVDIGPTDADETPDVPPLIFIHGLSGCWQNWLEQIPEFARDRRVIAVDLPGFGQSEMPAEEISISGYADAIDALMQELGIDAAQIVGNSMGGFIGAEMAIQYPARIERLVLVAAAGLSVETIRTERTNGLRHRAENVVFFTLGHVASRSYQVALRKRLRAALLSPRIRRSCRGRSPPSRCSARASPASPTRWRRCSTTRCATGSRRSPARRSSCGATRTASCR